MPLGTFPLATGADMDNIMDQSFQVKTDRENMHKAKGRVKPQRDDPSIWRIRWKNSKGPKVHISLPQQ